MKKIFSCFMILAGFLLIGNTNNVYAAEINTNTIPNSTYIIGKCLFTREISDSYKGSLSTDVIMLAAKTIESNNLEDMIIYYKNVRGVWVNALTNETIEMDEKINIEYKNNEVYLETPTLTKGHGTDEKVLYVGFTIETEGYYSKEETLKRIDGWELYEKTNNDYTLVEGHEVEVDIGETKTYVARAYALNKNNKKVYSEYSNEMVIDNSKVETPTLTKGHGTDEKVLYTGFTIKTEGYYSTEDKLIYIDGWELYEKTNNDYTLVEGHEVEVDVGETKTYVARAYALNKNNEKVYSEYSNEIVIDNSKVKKPTLAIGRGSKAIMLDAEFTIVTEGNYSQDENKNRIDGWELYEKTNNEYTLVEGHEVEVDIGETKTYVARAYALNKNNEKVYSEYSNEIVIDNSKVETPTLTNGHGAEDVAGFAITLEGYYEQQESLNTITGWELYEKTNDEYNLVDGYEVGIIKGEIKTYVARAYALNKNNEKIYSEYSNEVIVNAEN